jgi:hypothetical protein
MTGMELVLAQEVDYQVYTEPPRLFLTQRHFRLLKRERERESMRWVQFESLIVGKANMPEPGFASALYGAVSGSAAYCRAAGQWAVDRADGSDPSQARQMALVYDWCSEPMGEASASMLARKLTRLLKQRPEGTQAVRSLVLTALAVADVEPKAAGAALEWSVETWWRKKILPKLVPGSNPFPTRRDLFAVMEILHVVRDNLRVDLREGALAQRGE